MNKYVKLIMASAMALSLCACGGSSSSSSSTTTTSTTTTPKAVANIEPSSIDPGKNYSREGLTSDLWFSWGNDEDYFYLTRGNKEYYPSGFGISWYYNGEEVLDDSSYNEIEDMHLVSTEGSNLEFDLIFIDTFTAYDSVSGQYYSREGYSLDDIEPIFYDQYVESDKGNSLEFHSDYTVNEVWSKTEGTGTWYVLNATQISYTPDGDNNSYSFDVYLDDNGKLDYIDSFEMGTYYVE